MVGQTSLNDYTHIGEEDDNYDDGDHWYSQLYNLRWIEMVAGCSITSITRLNLIHFFSLRAELSWMGELLSSFHVCKVWQSFSFAHYNLYPCLQTFKISFELLLLVFLGTVCLKFHVLKKTSFSWKHALKISASFAILHFCSKAASSWSLSTWTLYSKSFQTHWKLISLTR